MSDDPKDEVIDELEQINEGREELDPERDLTWANTDLDMGYFEDE
jgi:hypothetical protein